MTDEVRIKAIAWATRGDKSYGGVFGEIVLTAKGDELRVNFYPDFTITVPGTGIVTVSFENYDREVLIEQEIAGSDVGDQIVWKNND